MRSHGNRTKRGWTSSGCTGTGLPDRRPLWSRAFPFELNDVFHFADHQNEIAWEPYKKGVDIFRLYGDGITGPTAALVRYRERGEVPMHEHKGYEHILILAGSQ